MTYLITNTSGSNSYSVTDGSLSTGYLDITLLGKGYIGYGTALNTNFLRLLENFSNTSAPGRPVTGQIWYDSLNASLKVYNGSGFVSVVNNQSDLSIGGLRLYNSAIIGQNTNANISITPNGTGYTVVNNFGITGTNTGKLLYTAANGSVRSTTMSYTTTGDTLTVTNINGTAFAGTSGSFNTASVTGNASIGNAVVSTAVYSPNYYYSNGSPFTSSSYGNIQVAAYLPTYTGNISAGNLTVTGNITGTASSAKYADLAENYEADQNYEIGTVVEFGGEFEITEGKINSTRVAGIISTNPAYLMNSEAKGNFILPVALSGRVPCKVVGPAFKGDMMVSAGDGYAIASSAPAIGTVIGKSLENLAGGIGVIEVVVGRC